MARQSEPPGNDNEDPDESWKRADLILQAYSGADLSDPEAQKTAISQLLTDLMHYSDVMSMTAKEGSPEHLDFEELLDAAFEDFSVQKDTMDGAMDIGPRRLAEIGEFFRQLRDGPKPAPPEPEKTAEPPDRVPDRAAASQQPQPQYDIPDDQQSYVPPEGWEQYHEQLERLEFRFHHGLWVEELKSVAAKSRDAADFKTAIEAAGQILARDSRGLIIMAEKHPESEEEFRSIVRFDASLTGQSDEEFKKFARAVDLAKIPSAEDARKILERQRGDRDAQRTVSANIIHDLTFTASNAKDFMRGLQEQAMILAREGEGKFAQFVVVDYEGEKYTLAHLVRPVKAPEFDAMMAAVHIQALPTVALARAEQLQLHESVQHPSRTIDLSAYSLASPVPEPTPQRAQAANDNLRTIRDPSKRAAMTLDAYSKFSAHTDVRRDGAPASVITALLKDLMHYSQARSGSQSHDSPEYVNFDRLSRVVARQEFERAQMTPHEAAEELAGFAPTLKLSELKEAAEDPQLEQLLNDLSGRQAKEAQDLSHKHEREVFGSPTPSQEERHERELLEQAREFDKERERYIAEYKESKAILAEMREDEKAREQERGDSAEDELGNSR